MLYFLSYEYYKHLNSNSDLQSHSRSLAIMPFDRPYMISHCLLLSLSCTISKVLMIISQNLKRSHNCDHARLTDYLSILRLILHTANQCTKLEVTSLSCSTDILGGLKWITLRDHATYRDGLSSIGWDLLRSPCLPNLKYLCSPTPLQRYKRQAKC